MKTKAPQFELPGQADVFNLAGEVIKQEPPQPKEKPDTGTIEMFPEYETNPQRN